MIKHSYLYLFLFVFIFGCSTPKTIQVMHVRQMEAEAGHSGFYYALPRTIISIDITVRKTEFIPGLFAEYAEQMLGLKDVIKNHFVNYDLANINISNYAEPDPMQFYFVKYDPEVYEDKPFYISLSESGLIKSINTKFDSNEFLKASDNDNSEYGYFGSKATFNYFLDRNIKEKVDTILQMIIEDTVIVERQILQRSWVEKGSKATASEVADFIMEVRNQKMDVISGFHEIPYSKEALEYMYSEMNRVEKGYLELFTGIIKTSNIKYRFNHIPDKVEVNKQKPVFRFCNKEGVFPVSERNIGSVVTLELRRNETTRQPEVFINRNVNPLKPESGFHYRIPEHANITIRIDNNIKAQARLLINQFGIIASLPPEHLEIEFYPNTGFVKSVGKTEVRTE